MERFNRKPHHASNKATAKFTTLKLIINRSAAVLRECFNGLFQHATIASRAAKWTSVEATSSTDVGSAIRFFLINLPAATRQTMKQAHAESDYVPNLQRLASCWLGYFNLIVRAISTIATRIFRNEIHKVIRDLDRVCFVMLDNKLMELGP